MRDIGPILIKLDILDYIGLYLKSLILIDQKQFNLLYKKGDCVLNSKPAGGNTTVADFQFV